MTKTNDDKGGDVKSLEVGDATEPSVKEILEHIDRSVLLCVSDELVVYDSDNVEMYRATTPISRDDSVSTPLLASSWLPRGSDMGRALAGLLVSREQKPLCVYLDDKVLSDAAYSRPVAYILGCVAIIAPMFAASIVVADGSLPTINDPVAVRTEVKSDADQGIKLVANPAEDSDDAMNGVVDLALSGKEGTLH